MKRNPMLLALYHYSDSLKQYFGNLHYMSHEKLITHDIVKLLIKYGLLDVIKYLIDDLKIKYSTELLTEASQLNKTEIIRYLLSITDNPSKWNYKLAIHVTQSIDDLKLILPLANITSENCFEGAYKSTLTSVIERATSNSNIEMIEWIIANLFKNEKQLIQSFLSLESMWEIAATNGHLELLRYLSKNDQDGFGYGDINFYFKRSNLLDRAARNNHFEVYKWLHSNGIGRATQSAIDYACYFNNIEMVHWLHDNHADNCSTYAMDYAATNGNLELVQWLHSNRTEGCTTVAMDEAAQHGHLEIVKWLHANRTEGCSDNAVTFALFSGKYEVVEWLRENSTEGCQGYVLNVLARSNEFEIMKWLVSENKKLNDHYELDWRYSAEIIKFAATNNNLEMMKYLNDNLEDFSYCFPNEEAFSMAAYHGNLEMIQWMHDIQPMTEFPSDIMDDAISSGNLEVVKWLNLNYPVKFTSESMGTAIENGYIDIVQWLHANIPDCSNDDIVDIAFMNNEIEIGKWLLLNRTERMSSKLYEMAVIRNDSEIIELISNRTN